MILETLLISLIVGILRKGQVSNLRYIKTDGWIFILIGFIISYLSIFLIARGNVSLTYNLAFIQAVSYFLIILGILYKAFSFDRLILAFGFFLNLIPMALSGGKMPVDGKGLISLGLNKQFILLKENLIVTHTLIDTTTRGVFLSDIIPLKYILPKLVSIGDLLIALGIFLLIQKSLSRCSNS